MKCDRCKEDMCSWKMTPLKAKHIKPEFGYTRGKGYKYLFCDECVKVVMITKPWKKIESPADSPAPSVWQKIKCYFGLHGHATSWYGNRHGYIFGDRCPHCRSWGSDHVTVQYDQLPEDWDY